ncbi:mechanosensitive ion channel [Thiohalophilus thiocyanatoxydans]|uniref:Mechanosensitive ion channel-like protein n=1 Tax=Thiohalophilus thiocyanatoxydans TaxID=381308 RepID=A0A4R8IFM0_9GAMM|nr:mechanosensitive ion channel [Thiohalophilus thiocyanatoxydans]TDX99320.1 mechanosensitive ion channel-like protein [Thiohalophilus thiocyanatoxydans]
MLRSLVETYPELAAVLVLVLGVIVGKLAEVAVRRLFLVGDRLISRFSGRSNYVVSPLFQQALALLVFATVLVLAAVIAVRLLNIPQLTAWLDMLFDYLPRFVLGLVIIGMGNVVGALLRNITAGMIAQGDGNALLPRLVHAAVVAVAVITGLQQLGIDISFITQLSLIILASLLGGLSIAFALGARQYVANLVAQPELTRYAIGDRLRIDADEGVIVEVYRTGLTLETDEGLVSIPAARLARGRVVRITPGPVSES